MKLCLLITSLLILALITGCTKPVSPPEESKTTTKSLGEVATPHFALGDEPFQFVGAFVPSWKTGGLPEPKSESEKKAFMEKLPQATDNLIATAKMAGLNVLTLILGWSKNDSENEMALGKLDVFLDRASAHGIRVIVTFLHGVGLTLDKTDRFHNAGGVEGLIRDENLKVAYKELIKRVVTRVNKVNGEKYSDDPTIMAWDLITEPFVDPGKFIQGAGESTLTEEELGSWVQEMVTYTKSIDSNHLVTMMLSSPLVNWPLSVKALDFVAFDVNLYDILYVEERSKNQPLGNDYIEKFIRYPLSSIGKPFVPQLAFTTPWLTEEFATDYELQGQIYKEALQKGFESGIAGAIIFSWGDTGVPLFNFENYLGYDITDEEIIIPIKEIVAGLPPIDGSKSSSQFVRIAP